MAVRGVVTTLAIYPANYDFNTAPLYRFQNHFPGNRTISGATYAYNSFETTPSSMVRDSSVDNVTITFVATASNVDLVEAAIANRYVFIMAIYRWGSIEGIDNPSGFNLLSIFAGNAVTGSSDFYTVTLEIGGYSDSLNSDLPWRKIPWTILGPLSFRR